MGWKGTLRTVTRISNQVERQSRMRQRELQAQENKFNKMQEIERANYEVQKYENDIDVLLSIHKDCGNIWDWKKIQTSEPPPKPQKSNTLEKLALLAKESYKPSTLDKLMNKVNSKQEQFYKAIKAAALEDENKYKADITEYEQQLEDWKILSQLAEKILQQAPKSYLDAINLINPFEEVDQLGTNIDFRVDRNIIEVILNVNSEQVIPSETKFLLKSGKLSIKETPKSKLYQMHQDYVCAAVLRIARELFALLPIEMVLITAIMPILSTQTGLKEEYPILSVVIPKKTIMNFNFEMIDPSDSMNNFIHNMNFNKAKGFTKIERIKSDNLQLG